MKRGKIVAKETEFSKIIPHKIEYKEITRLGISTGITGKSFSLTKIINMKNNPGWIVRGDSIEEWKITGFCHYKNETYLYGPWVEGKSLEEILTLESGKFLPFFETLISSLTALYDHFNRDDETVPFFRLSTHSVFFLDDGGILFLPPVIMKELIELRPFEVKAHFYSVCNHPDRDGEINLSFSLGVFLYRVITGKYPYYSSDQEELHYMIRELVPASPHIARPGLKREVVQLIKTSLSGVRIKIPQLMIWEKAVKSWIDEGIEEEKTEEEKHLIVETEKQKEEKALKQFHSRVFFKKNSIKIAVITGIVLLIGSMAGFFIQRIFFRSRVTAGLSPLEVVQTYYKSINALDHLTLSDCVVNRAGKGELHTVINLYVITKQSIAYGDSVNFISAEEWDKKGRPELPPFTPMYGVVNVKIEQKSAEPEPIFRSSYEKWYTETGDTDPGLTQGTVMYFGSAVTELLYLKKAGKAWVIYKIDELKRQILNQGPLD
jgi:hypothetical protein